MQAHFKGADHIIIKADKSYGSVLKMNGSWIKHHNTNLSLLKSIKSLSVRLGEWGKYLAERAIIRKKTMPFKMDLLPGTKYRPLARITNLEMLNKLLICM